MLLFCFNQNNLRNNSYFGSYIAKYKFDSLRNCIRKARFISRFKVYGTENLEIETSNIYKDSGGNGRIEGTCSSIE